MSYWNICEECKHAFNIDDVSVARDEAVGYASCLCPNCGSEDFVGAKMCAVCGELHDESDIICPDCAEEVMAKFKLFRRGLKEAEIKYLNYAFDGLEF